MNNLYEINGLLSDEEMQLSGDLSILGVRGYSAYELAVQNGYTGTLEEFVYQLTHMNYEEAFNKPKINGKELIGNVSLNEIGVYENDYASNLDIDNLFK